jgi:phosphoribosylamine--glycine ligase
LYLASVDYKNNILLESGSRTVAMVGIADTLFEAETISENDIKLIEGPLFHRKDIGTNQLINKRINHMKALRD